MKIGVFGGSFNPPHVGHVDNATATQRQLGLDLLLVVPSGVPPHKALPQNTPTAQERLEMTQIAFRDVPRCKVLDIELRRAGESYTVDTLIELRGQYPDAEFFLIVGTDMYLTLTQWHKAGELLSLATPAVGLRELGMEPHTEAEAERLAAFGIKTEIVENDTIEISSSELRRQLAERIWSRQLDYSVYSFIIERGLYNARPNLDWLRFEAYKLLDDRRIRHVAGCESEAVCLARHWGADETDAREGAILHDITKRLGNDEQLALCEKYGIEVDDFMHSTPKILHGHTGAELAAERFNVSDAVKSAIKWHTTGRADMTLLEKIVYLADYMEPNRTFDGVAELRELAYRDLDAAVILGLQMNFDDLTARGLEFDKNAVEAMNSLTKKD